MDNARKYSPKLYVLVGCSGSGKSTFAKKIQNDDTVIISTDAIRKELFGREECQRESERVFAIAHYRVKAALLEDRNVIFDATNTTTKGRKSLLEYVEKTYCWKVAIVFAAPVDECKRRNQMRDRKVPDAVIERQFKQYMRDAQTIPDQFDEIVVVR